MEMNIPHIKYKALVIEEQGTEFVRSIQEKNTADLPQGDVLVRVHYSSLNYKDALSANGNKGITKKYPHTPGIDASGEVVWSNTDEFAIGDKVVVTGNDLGMNTPGGFGEYISVPAEWVVKLPAGLSLKEAMIIGTAGFTAAIMVKRILDVIQPSDGEVIVTGATGGVGSLGVALLSKIGFSVVAVTGKEAEMPFLEKLGAKRCITRDAVQNKESRPLLSATYAGALDTVGGAVLENIIKSTQPFGVITCCGNVASPTLDLTVFPFILRGVSLVGVSSQNTHLHLRKEVWTKLATDWKLVFDESMYSLVSLDELSDKIDLISQGKIKGRTVVKMI